MLKKIKSFLFENKTDKQTIIKNTFWLMLAEGVSKGGMFFITILIARILGPEQFGILSFVMSFVAMFIVITDFGLTTLMVREVSRDHSKIKDYLVNLSFLKVVLGIITFIIVWTVSQFIGKDSFYITLILIYCGYAIINNFGEFIRAFFRPSEKMQYEALLKIINGVLMLSIVLGSLFLYGDLESILYGYLIAGGMSLVVSLGYVGRKFEVGELKLNKNILFNTLKSGGIIGFSLFFISLYISSDQVIMGLYNQTKELGTYGLAYRFVLIYSMISSIIFITIFPQINKTNYLNNINKNYKEGFKKIFKYNLILFIIFEILFYIFLNYLNIFSEYSNIYMVTSLLFIYVLFEPLGHWGYLNISSIKKDNINLLFIFITSIINIILNLYLIPLYSYYGAIFSTILVYILYLIFTYMYIKLFIKNKFNFFI